MFLERAQSENTAIIMVTHNMAMANRLNKVYKLDYSLLEVKI
jgi:ABC-type lipoprotein export system ATPase subunit